MKKNEKVKTLVVVSTEIIDFEGNEKFESFKFSINREGVHNYDQILGFEEGCTFCLASACKNEENKEYVDNLFRRSLGIYKEKFGEFPESTYLFYHRKEWGRMERFGIIDPSKLSRPEGYQNEYKVAIFKHDEKLPLIRWLKGATERFDPQSMLENYESLQKQEKELFDKYKMQEKIKGQKDIATKEEEESLFLKICSKITLNKVDLTIKENGIQFICLPLFGYLDNNREEINKIVSNLGGLESKTPCLLITPLNLLFDNNAEKAVSLYVDLDPRIRFFDSGIWFRYVSMETDQYGIDFEQQFSQAVAYFEKAKEKNLYQTNVCKEYRDLQVRLFKESYLKDFGSHASSVTPFRFHSEKEMDKEAKSTLQLFLDKKIKWNFLLIDDFADKGLRINKNDQTQKSKGDLVQEIIDEHLIEKFEKVKEVEYEVVFRGENRDWRADVLLLDYLFSHDANGVELATPRYGIELIKKLNMPYLDTENQEMAAPSEESQRGPFFRYWIFPVTAFTDALASDMQRFNYPYIQENYYIARGADPINTPYLFLSSLLNFLKLQYEKVFFEEKDIYYFFLNNPAPDNRQLRDWARKLLVTFLDRFAMIDTIGNKPHNTAFEKTVAQYLREIREKPVTHLPLLVESIRSLLYNLAYLSDMPSNKDAAKRSYDVFRESFNSWKKTNAPALKGLEENVFVTINRIGEYIVTPRNNY